MPQTAHRLLLILFCASSLCWFIRRDIQLEKLYTGDLRNRVVGARLQKDGQPPYFYKWNISDSTRYYDPQNFDSFKVSNITATPFMHQLLYPVADMPQRSISRLWLVLEYFLLVITVILAFSFARSRRQQWLVVITVALFLFTSPWQIHIAAGQYYIFIPALTMLVYYFIVEKHSLLFSFLAGIAGASLLLIRPNALLIFLPFIFIIHLLLNKRGLVLLGGAAIVFLFAFAGHNSFSNWNNFRSALKEQVKLHQDDHPAIAHNTPDPGWQSLEGWNKEQLKKDAAAHPFHVVSEHGNLFAIINRLLHIKMQAGVLAALTLVSILLLLFMFYKNKIKRKEYYPVNLVLAGYCLYMVSDLCSPFYRFEYNGTQWLFPLLLIATHYSRRYRAACALILAGLLLCILQVQASSFEHTLGEYIIFVGILLLAFLYRPASTLGEN